MGDWQKVFQAAEQVKHNNKQATASPGRAERGRYPVKSACKDYEVQNILNDFSAALLFPPLYAGVLASEGGAEREEGRGGRACVC